MNIYNFKYDVNNPDYECKDEFRIMEDKEYSYDYHNIVNITETDFRNILEMFIDKFGRFRIIDDKYLTLV